MWFDQERSDVNRIPRYLKVGVVSSGHPLIEMGDVGCVIRFLRETSINLHFRDTCSTSHCLVSILNGCRAKGCRQRSAGVRKGVHSWEVPMHIQCHRSLSISACWTVVHKRWDRAQTSL